MPVDTGRVLLAFMDLPLFTCLVELLDSPDWRDAHGGDEQGGARLDHDVNQLWETAISVIVVGFPGISANLEK